MDVPAKFHFLSVYEAYQILWSQNHPRVRVAHPKLKLDITASTDIKSIFILLAKSTQRRQVKICS